MKRLLALLCCLSATPLGAQDIVSYTTDQSYADAAFGLENAILNEGLVIDSVSHVGDMLARTRGDVGSEVELFAKADAYSFCSATVSREVMEINPMNIAFCPYNIFVAEMAGGDGEVIIGYRTFPEGEMQKVQELLDGLVRAAIGLE
ncbi:DUF302 domain-containing protein [Roseovarius aestuariivivens]|uniref:DUF302 domain-containing protein n=1 Tax=Roseovarius aestuariivivens TaxID=1888910 RepID=UPI001081175B|nr:DUF302 domain-containing protein [Roseovarius aestuariivivens]